MAFYSTLKTALPSELRARDAPGSKPGLRYYAAPSVAIIIEIATFTAAPLAAAQTALKDLSATRNRPLFVPTRRPPEPARAVSLAPTNLPAAPQPPPMQLSGVVIGPGRTFAVVKRDTDAKLFILDVGRDLDGWTVTAIRPREIDLGKAGQLATLRLPTR